MRTLMLVFAGCVLASGLVAGEKKAKDAKEEFKMNPKLANLGDNTWLKMSPKYKKFQPANPKFPIGCESCRRETLWKRLISLPSNRSVQPFPLSAK